MVGFFVPARKAVLILPQDTTEIPVTVDIHQILDKLDLVKETHSNQQIPAVRRKLPPKLTESVSKQLNAITHLRKLLHQTVRDGNDNPFQGDCLSDYAEFWEEMKAPQHILNTIKGYKLPFVKRPPLTSFKKGHLTKFSTVGMEAEVETMIKQSIPEKSSSSTGFVSKMFPRQKPDGKIRPILNLKRLNQYLQISKFRLISHLRVPDFLQEEDFMQAVELPTSMDISSSMLDPTSAATSQSRFRNVHCHSAEIGKSFLENRCKSASVSPSPSYTESAPSSNRLVDESTTLPKPLTKIGSLENTGWARGLTHWKGKDAQLLTSSWKKSSLKTHSAPWREWLAWCSRNNIPQDPSPDQVAQYLGFLHRQKKLAPSTIKLYKSNPMRSERLAGNPIVRHMLKAIDLSRPPATNRKQTWDVNKLLSWIHGLTLLKVDEYSMELNDATVILWPEFGSKTDKSLYRQSGWFLKRCSKIQHDPVFWIHQMVAVTSTRRKVKDGLINLFITTRGQVKPASRTVLAGWIKTAFSEAGISFPPGSIRSAVASARFENNVPLDIILEKDNWQGSQNFYKYYYKEIQKPSLRETQTDLIQSSFSVAE
ncbi:unnamed protein product [Acanthoscelides obtectus]|uniref:Core-binding (CB) domain-containing protein n=1 Tax=Acanthoscelides obtectus TaxID=200917 RepID=A0A9P0M5K0_ACAOB|nr:unnamed protein product [Acanthoscelides obtectus]CAK1655898.1 hypothetical protein AOBTE_LOCUS19422 [Acanthoscelides obtectus]